MVGYINMCNLYIYIYSEHDYIVYVGRRTMGPLYRQKMNRHGNSNQCREHGMGYVRFYAFLFFANKPSWWHGCRTSLSCHTPHSRVEWGRPTEVLHNAKNAGHCLMITLWKIIIAMDNHPFIIADLPIKNEMFHSHVSFQSLHPLLYPASGRTSSPAPPPALRAALGCALGCALRARCGAPRAGARRPCGSMEFVSRKRGYGGIVGASGGLFFYSPSLEVLHGDIQYKLEG